MYGVKPRRLLRHQGGGTRPYPKGLGDYIDAGNLLAPMPKGIRLRVPA